MPPPVFHPPPPPRLPTSAIPKPPGTSPRVVTGSIGPSFPPKPPSAPNMTSSISSAPIPPVRGMGPGGVGGGGLLPPPPIGLHNSYPDASVIHSTSNIHVNAPPPSSMPLKSSRNSLTSVDSTGSNQHQSSTSTSSVPSSLPRSHISLPQPPQLSGNFSRGSSESLTTQSSTPVTLNSGINQSSGIVGQSSGTLSSPSSQTLASNDVISKNESEKTSATPVSTTNYTLSGTPSVLAPSLDSTSHATPAALIQEMEKELQALRLEVRMRKGENQYIRTEMEKLTEAKSRYAERNAEMERQLKAERQQFEASNDKTVELNSLRAELDFFTQLAKSLDSSKAAVERRESKYKEDNEKLKKQLDQLLAERASQQNLNLQFDLHSSTNNDLKNSSNVSTQVNSMMGIPGMLNEFDSLSGTSSLMAPSFRQGLRGLSKSPTSASAHAEIPSQSAAVSSQKKFKPSAGIISSPHQQDLTTSSQRIIPAAISSPMPSRTPYESQSPDLSVQDLLESHSSPQSRLNSNVNARQSNLTSSTQVSTIPGLSTFDSDGDSDSLLMQSHRAALERLELIVLRQQRALLEARTRSTENSLFSALSDDQTLRFAVMALSGQLPVHYLHHCFKHSKSINGFDEIDELCELLDSSSLSSRSESSPSGPASWQHTCLDKDILTLGQRAFTSSVYTLLGYLSHTHSDLQELFNPITLSTIQGSLLSLYSEIDAGISSTESEDDGPVVPNKRLSSSGGARGSNTTPDRSATASSVPLTMVAAHSSSNGVSASAHDVQLSKTDLLFVTTTFSSKFKTLFEDALIEMGSPPVTHINNNPLTTASTLSHSMGGFSSGLRSPIIAASNSLTNSLSHSSLGAEVVPSAMERLCRFLLLSLVSLVLPPQLMATHAVSSHKSESTPLKSSNSSARTIPATTKESTAATPNCKTSEKGNENSTLTVELRLPILADFPLGTFEHVIGIIRVLRFFMSVPSASAALSAAMISPLVHSNSVSGSGPWGTFSSIGSSAGKGPVAASPLSPPSVTHSFSSSSVASPSFSAFSGHLKDPLDALLARKTHLPASLAMNRPNLSELSTSHGTSLATSTISSVSSNLCTVFAVLSLLPGACLDALTEDSRLLLTASSANEISTSGGAISTGSSTRFGVLAGESLRSGLHAFQIAGESCRVLCQLLRSGMERLSVLPQLFERCTGASCVQDLSLQRLSLPDSGFMRSRGQEISAGLATAAAVAIRLQSATVAELLRSSPLSPSTRLSQRQAELAQAGTSLLGHGGLLRQRLVFELESADPSGAVVIPTLLDRIHLFVTSQSLSTLHAFILFGGIVGNTWKLTPAAIPPPDVAHPSLLSAASQEDFSFGSAATRKVFPISSPFVSAAIYSVRSPLVCLAVAVSGCLELCAATLESNPTISAHGDFLVLNVRKSILETQYAIVQVLGGLVDTLGPRLFTGAVDVSHLLPKSEEKNEIVEGSDAKRRKLDSSSSSSSDPLQPPQFTCTSTNVSEYSSGFVLFNGNSLESLRLLFMKSRVVLSGDLLSTLPRLLLLASGYATLSDTLMSHPLSSSLDGIRDKEALLQLKILRESVELVARCIKGSYAHLPNKSISSSSSTLSSSEEDIDSVLLSLCGVMQGEEAVQGTFTRFPILQDSLSTMKSPALSSASVDLFFSRLLFRGGLLEHGWTETGLFRHPLINLAGSELFGVDSLFFIGSHSTIDPLLFGRLFRRLRMLVGTS